MTIRELVEKFDEAAQAWGWERDWGYGAGVDEAKEAHASARAALLAAIDRLERKAATAKAESDAWREQEAAHADLITTDPEKLEAAHERINAADRALDAARATTDEAWKEPEGKETQP